MDNFYSVALLLHSLLRWAIIIVLFALVVKLLFLRKPLYSKRWMLLSLLLMILSHTTLLIGLYQYFFGGKGFVLIRNLGMKMAMSESTIRFWSVEHPLCMLFAIGLITRSYRIAKYSAMGGRKQGLLLFMYLLALVLILSAVPWPFRHLGVATWM